jgi:hypothetical protein
MWGRKLLINTMLKGKLTKRGISELSPIVTVNSFQAVGMHIVQSQSLASKVPKHFILAFQEENPRVTRVVINNDKNMPLASHVANPRGTDNVHMEQLSVTPSSKAKPRAHSMCAQKSCLHTYHTETRYRLSNVTI